MNQKQERHLLFVCDRRRHLVCLPYSIENLHAMAHELGIKRAWFHLTHFDIPARRVDEVTARCVIVSPRNIVRIIRGELTELNPKERDHEAE